jgi:hypothetical protein
LGKVCAAQHPYRTHPPLAQLDDAVRALRDVAGAMCRRDPRAACGPRRGEYPVDAAPEARVQTVVKLIQAQPVRGGDQGACEQREPLLPIGQRQETPFSQSLETAGAQSRFDPVAFRARCGSQQQIRAV